MPISHKHKCIFIHIPKNAGTSVSETLEMNTEAGHENWKLAKKRYEDYWKQYLKFTISRNPYERFISCYNYSLTKNSYWHSNNGNTKYGEHPDYKKIKNMDINLVAKKLYFKEIELKHLGWKNQWPYIFENENMKIDKIIKKENLNEFIENKFGLILKKLNPSDKIKTSLNLEGIKYIKLLYNKDFNLLNYEK